MNASRERELQSKITALKPNSLSFNCQELQEIFTELLEECVIWDILMANYFPFIPQDLLGQSPEDVAKHLVEFNMIDGKMTLMGQYLLVQTAFDLSNFVISENNGEQV